MLKTTKRLDLYVLDSLSNDIEDIESITRMLNSDSELGWKKEWGAEFSRLDIVTSLTRMVKNDLVRVLAIQGDSPTLTELRSQQMPDSDLDALCFAITARGRMVHGAWELPPEETPST